MKLQDLYYLSQDILDEIFNLDSKIARLIAKGKQPKKLKSDRECKVNEYFSIKNKMTALERVSA